MNGTKAAIQIVILISTLAIIAAFAFDYFDLNHPGPNGFPR